LSFDIELTASARRALTLELPEKAAVACWEFIRGSLAENPHRVGKPLKGRFEGFYAAQRGEFRVIYEIIENRVLVRVINIDHRRDIYR
jgi:mRNA interferase RelE/StbE